MAKKKKSKIKNIKPVNHIPTGTPKYVMNVDQASLLTTQFFNSKNARKKYPVKIVKYDELGNQISNNQEFEKITITRPKSKSVNNS